MLPLFEQGTLANAFNFDLGAEGCAGGGLAVAADYFVNSTATVTKIGIFLNPFCNGGALSGPILTKGNYAVNWGNANWEQSSIPGVVFQLSPFSHDENISFASIQDGLSTTVIVGEVLQGATYDVRGVVCRASREAVLS